MIAEGKIVKKNLIYKAFLTCCFGMGFATYSFADNTQTEGQFYLFDNINVAEQSTTEITGLENSYVNMDEAVDLEADQVEYDETNSIVSAIGNVELVQAGRILRADKIVYSLAKDDVQATGNVVLNEQTGDTYFADSVQLKDKMKDGFVRGLSGVLADGSRFTAEEAEKIADLKVIMHKASYTACEPCKKDPTKPPVWQIKARNVTHHKDEARVSYDDATFEVAGVPVAYAPYFSHPDGSVKQKSGFLIPTAGFDSVLGASYDQKYYWGIDKDKDATLGMVVFTNENPLVTGQYRQRFKDAEVKLDGSATHSSRTDLIDSKDVEVGKETRGHMFVDGLWNINDKWRAGTELNLVSDEQYLRQYNISNKDILENTIYAERFENRNYTNARIINFKDVRTSENRKDQPNVLPEIYSNFIGAPNETLGGRWDLELSALGLQREGSGQDMNRGSVKLGWEKRHISNVGFVNTVDLTARGDAYNINDRDIATAQNGRNNSSSAMRGFGQAHLQSSYPVAKDFKKSKLVIEPLASLTTGTNLNPDDGIPNEDSQDISLDATNLFTSNRFPGKDLIEDESFTTYGVRTGLHTDNGYKGEVFLGQSYRLDNTQNPFPQGSGFSEQSSDVIGNISIAAGNALQLNYATQLDNTSLASQRHEFDVTSTIGKLALNTRYFYVKGYQDDEVSDSREQGLVSGRYALTDNWGVSSAFQYDFAKETEGLRYARYGLDYQGQCANFVITAQRSLTRDSSGDSGTEIMLRLGLKNLGEFETSSFKIGNNNDDDIVNPTDNIEQ